MKNLFKLLGVIALVLLVGFSFIACENPANDKKNGGVFPKELQGKWEDKNNPTYITVEVTKNEMIFGGTMGTSINDTFKVLLDSGAKWYTDDDEIGFEVAGFKQKYYGYSLANGELTMTATNGAVVSVLVKQ